MRRVIGLGLGVVALGIAPNALSEVSGNLPVLKGRATAGASAVALADFNGKTVALVADEDDSAIHVFETSPPKEIAVAKVPGAPTQVLVTKAGRVYVSLRDKGQVAILEGKGGDARQLIQKGTIDTGGEPIALATTPDVSAYNLADRSLKFSTVVDREPRAIAMSSDGSRAFVTHAMGAKLTTVTMADGTSRVADTSASATNGNVNAVPRTRVGTQGFAIARREGKIFAPMVMADPETPETYYGSSLETLSVIVVDEVSGAISSGTQVAIQGYAYPRPLEKCLLPRAAAVTNDGKLFVGCAGEKDVYGFDATASDPKSKPVATRAFSDSIAAIAIDEGAKSLVAWSQMGRSLSVGGLDGSAPVVAKASGGPGDTAIARGRRLFHNVEGKTASDGRSCASCHTDGRDDGLVWNTPEGERQTPMLAGRLADTAPYGWTRDAKTFHDYVNGTVQRLQGHGFQKTELDDLAAYVMSLKGPTQKTDTALVEKGKALFASASTGCATCHSGAATTDNAKHGIVDPKTKVEQAYATPSLRFVGGTAPYFHDGRYNTLRSLLVSNDAYMGRARSLDAADLDALEAYLKSL